LAWEKEKIIQIPHRVANDELFVLRDSASAWKKNKPSC
jgi:hypothetical protein